MLEWIQPQQAEIPTKILFINISWRQLCTSHNTVRNCKIVTYLNTTCNTASTSDFPGLRRCLASRWVLRRQSCPFSPYICTRKFIILFCLNTSPDKLKWIHIFFICQAAAITSSMDHFSYETYGLLTGQHFFLSKIPNNFCGLQKYYQLLSSSLFFIWTRNWVKNKTSSFKLAA
jgi:hypothetical protein